MLADLDLLLIAVFCTADDLLPKGVKNAKRMLTDAEVVTLCVAQAMMGIPSDARFLKTARKQLSHLFPVLPKRPGYLKRRQRLSDAIEALIAVFASDSPGFHDDLVLVDSTPVECARSIETTRRSQLADAADYGYCASHSRYFWGFRLHGLFALDGTPRALILTSPKASERDVCLTLLERCQRDGHLFVIGDKGYAGRDFELPPFLRTADRLVSMSPGEEGEARCHRGFRGRIRRSSGVRLSGWSRRPAAATRMSLLSSGSAPSRCGSGSSRASSTRGSARTG